MACPLYTKRSDERIDKIVGMRILIWWCATGVPWNGENVAWRTGTGTGTRHRTATRRDETTVHAAYIIVEGHIADRRGFVGLAAVLCDL